MHVLSGRRRSVSTAAPSNTGASKNSESSPRRASFSLENSRDYGASGRNTLRNLFHKHGAAPVTEDGSGTDVPHASIEEHGNAKSTTTPKAQLVKDPGRHDHSLDSSRSKHTHHSDERGERQDASNPTTDTLAKPHKADVNDKPPSETHLSRDDIHAIFSGAPYFLLEKGKHGLWYPQVIFPWDDHDPTIQHLWDRKLLPHPSYTLCTLHAHLPVPEGFLEGDAPLLLDSWKRTGAPKRATFDIGIFEVPNMLAMSGIEPGTVGFRHFLELPVADSVRFVHTGTPHLHTNLLHIHTLPAVQADELLEHYHEPYSQCLDGTIHDRKTLLGDGPTAWKRIGLRDINFKALVDRLEALRNLRHELLYENTQKTILDVESAHALYSDLFSKFLHPPPRFMLTDLDSTHGLKAEIKALTMVLATPGAWFDFSLVDWRFRIGQLLWEAPPHVDGDFFDPSTIHNPWAHPGLEQKWFLIQMLLAAELLLRLDAIVKVGLVESSKDVSVSAQDVSHFDKLRNPKVDWDLVVVRRFFDSFKISWGDCQSAAVSNAPSQPSTQEKSSQKARRFSFFDSITRRHSVASSPHSDVHGMFRLTPTHVEQQVEGLLAFAENIGWPRVDSLRKTFASTLHRGFPNQNITDMFNRPVRGASVEGHMEGSTTDATFKRLATRRLVALSGPSSDDSKSTMGGWITRCWLSGFVIPGKAINHLLMATVLENDQEVIARLGSVANLYGGFALNGKSWWSQECIVGRVLSALKETKACMGWISSTNIPKEYQTQEPLDDAWFEVIVSEPPTGLGKPRIKQGNKISVESTPLGLGSLVSGEFTLPVDDVPEAKSPVDVKFNALTFSTKEERRNSNQHTMVARKATMNFSLRSEASTTTTDVSFPLTYNVNFVTSHACRLPPGLASYQHNASLDIEDDKGDRSRSLSPAEAFSLKYGRLPGHPLPSSYRYKYLALDDLPGPEGSSIAKVFEHAGFDLTVDEVFIVDARRCAEKEALARSWCASVGYDAIIGRTGRTCLGCCIREARALAVKVVIRVGD
ncbi:hypothetical protein ALT_1175 [Aspergillus lentulus]|uniref:Uncharacterized protein n=1 Tax=Aspergillus lentulus TaxID=293939 RepID=A0AAN4T7J7_ASPLE|nr:uncharacterized protein IFM58399_07059 [Aspergillus lentulus]KAF4151644.1 hypothetical protein CNMCM6069_003286 [Aspergillus lentulus]KAF4160474.1 hypothetical protein CNMCM6936_003931 [Aspergillus lentulus]KAF4177408.1 hypothetical protein CNMCM7927_003199 [Aspergillus lentulus]GAQ03854.1 hypothetical protein ALT_1175 [Aspergillus lentulus]GFF43770.1 hypothetical protein IFM58399_07059 [Aspergillus lentulus]